MQQRNSFEDKDTSVENQDSIHYKDKFGNTIHVSPDTEVDDERLLLSKNGLMSQSVTYDHFKRLIARGTLIEVEENKTDREQLSA